MPENEDKIILNGEEVTEEQVTEMLKGKIHTKEVVISLGEKRQIRQYEMNDYNGEVTIGIEGFSPLLNELDVNPNIRKKLSAIAFGMLTTRINQMSNFLKTWLHKQQELDKMPVIDFRPGEKAGTDD